LLTVAVNERMLANQHDSLVAYDRGSEMKHNEGLLKEVVATMYLWAAAGVSIAVIFAVVAL
jgi:hypothetical protein